MSVDRRPRNLFMQSALLLILLSSALFGQDAAADRISVNLSDPSRPGTVKVDLLNGGITVRSHAGKDVIIEATARERSSRRSQERTQAGGLKKLVNSSTGLTIVEQNNVIEVSTEAIQRPVDLVILVPTQTALRLHTVNSGDILVESVEGELEVDNTNGSVTLRDISGSAVAHALNGNIKVTFKKVTPAKSMSFSSLNGNIDVTLPASIRANVTMKTDNGDIYSDFDVQLEASPAKPVVEDARGQGGKYRVRVDRSMQGKINGGGAEILFKNFNGNIYIRKGA